MEMQLHFSTPAQNTVKVNLGFVLSPREDALGLKRHYAGVYDRSWHRRSRYPHVPTLRVWSVLGGTNSYGPTVYGE